MITKADAASAAFEYNRQFVIRVFDQLAALSRAGFTGCTASYGNAGPAIITASIAILQAAGWTVVQDDVNKILTIS